MGGGGLCIRIYILYIYIYFFYITVSYLVLKTKRGLRRVCSFFFPLLCFGEDLDILTDQYLQIRTAMGCCVLIAKELEQSCLTNTAFIFEVEIGLSPPSCSKDIFDVR